MKAAQPMARADTHSAEVPLLCERPIALAGDALRRRIYAPLSYATVRNVAVVPIVHSECPTLASWFPLVWRRRQATVDFVAIRALLNRQRAQPPAARALLPLLLHAYTLLLSLSVTPSRRICPYRIDREFPIRPPAALTPLADESFTHCDLKSRPAAPSTPAALPSHPQSPFPPTSR